MKLLAFATRIISLTPSKLNPFVPHTPSAVEEPFTEALLSPKKSKAVVVLLSSKCHNATGTSGAGEPEASFSVLP